MFAPEEVGRQIIEQDDAAAQGGVEEGAGQLAERGQDDTKGYCIVSADEDAQPDRWKARASPSLKNEDSADQPSGRAGYHQHLQKRIVQARVVYRSQTRVAESLPDADQAQ